MAPTTMVAMMSRHVTGYDLSAPTPFTEGRRVTIEASAGTGKTFTLTATVARLVAEKDLQANQLLMMTFTNAATEELRQATRERCQSALTYLRTGEHFENWMTHLAPEDVSRRQLHIERLEEFLAHYDEVTITTIHGFCQMVLRRSGLASLAPPNFELIPNVDHIVDQTITDLVAAKLARSPAYLSSAVDDDGNPVHPAKSSTLRSSLDALRSAVIMMLNNDGAVMLPVPAGDSLAHDPSSFEVAVNANGTMKKSAEKYRNATSLAQVIADEARVVVAEVRARCTKLGVVTYNDLIRLVQESLDLTTEAGHKLARQLAEQFPVIMVDEFQDTDTCQAAIFDAVFDTGAGDTTLFTVGDPKQAIYRFRGADVNVYLNARDRADETYELATNWRSDAAVLDAVRALLSKVTFDIDGEVGFTNVAARPGASRHSSGLHFDSPSEIDSAAFELRFIPTHHMYCEDGSPTNAKPMVDRRFFANVAERVGELIATARLDGPNGPRAVSPSDFAVLVHNHFQAQDVVAHLNEAKIPAVQVKTGSVFATDAALHWMMFLKGLARPAAPKAVRTFALSWFGGMSEGDLLVADDARIEEQQRRCVEAAELLSRKGITATYLSFRSQPAFLLRVLSQTDGLRQLTDLDHVAEVLETHPELLGGKGPAECLSVMTSLMDEQSQDADNQQRRIQTDLDAVKVMTIHASKGLEFPIVVLPTLHHVPRSRTPWMFPARFAADQPSVRTIDVASGVKNAADWLFTPTVLTGPDADDLMRSSFQKNSQPRGRKQLTKNDVDADQRRLMYVALTRAKHKVIGFWSPVVKKPSDPFVGAMRLATNSSAQLTTADEIQDVVDALHRDSHGAIVGLDISETSEVDVVDAPGGARRDADAMACAGFQRPSESVSVFGFGRWSYSSIVSRLKAQSFETEPGVAVEELPGATDEANEDGTDAPTAARAPEAWERLPAGAGFGNAVHQVFDRIDPAVNDLPGEVSRVIDEVFMSWSDDIDREHLASSLVTNLVTALDSMFAGFSLAQLGTKNRLSELRFDFPLRSDEATAVDAIVEALIDDANLPDQAREHFMRVLEEGSTNLRIGGFMNGSIDAVFRIPTEPASFIVSDYKTNRLHPEGAVNWRDYYGQDHLVAAMVKDGYYIQAVVYAVALHRYLRHRLPDYSLDTHFGGVSYLFLRGLTGSRDASGAMHGLYIWKPSETLVRRVDELFTEALV